MELQGSVVSPNLVAIERAFFDSVRNNRCIPFLGGGFTLGCESDQPLTYSGFAEYACVILDGDVKRVRASSSSIYEEVVRDLGAAWLREQICRVAGVARPGPPQMEFARIDWPYILTTNHDFLIERALGGENKRYSVCATEDACSAVSGPGGFGPASTVSLIKLLGDCSNMQAMNVAPSELAYDRYSAKKPHLAELVAAILGQWNAVMIGYSVSDPHLGLVSELLRESRELANQEERTDYIVLEDPGEAEVEKAKELGFRVVQIASASRTPGEGLREFFARITAVVEKGPGRDTLRRAATSTKCRALVPRYAARADRRGERLLEFHKCDQELGEVVPLLHSSQRPYLAIWSQESLQSLWFNALSVVAQQLGCGVVTLNFRQFLPDLSAAIPVIMETMQRGALIASVIDFTARPEAAVVATSCLQASVPVIAVAQSESQIPLFLFFSIRHVLYDLAQLESADEESLRFLADILGQMALVGPLQESEELLSDGKAKQAFIQTAIGLETALKQIASRVSIQSSRKCRTKKPGGLIRFLEKSEEGMVPFFPAEKLLSIVDVRNAVMHERAEVSPSEARDALELTKRLVRMNLGPNIIGFAMDMQTAKRDSGSANAAR